jgi:hypothetical protein
MAAEQSLGSEEGHLSVVGDRADPAEGLGEVLDPPGAEAIPDFGKAPELHGRAEGVSHSLAQQTPPEAALQSGGDGMAPPAGERCVLLSHGFYGDSRSEGDWIIFPYRRYHQSLALILFSILKLRYEIFDLLQCFPAKRSVLGCAPGGKSPGVISLRRGPRSATADRPRRLFES